MSRSYWNPPGQRGLWNLLQFWPFRLLLLGILLYGVVVGGIGYLIHLLTH